MGTLTQWENPHNSRVFYINIYMQIYIHIYHTYILYICVWYICIDMYNVYVYNMYISHKERVIIFKEKHFRNKYSRWSLLK